MRIRLAFVRKGPGRGEIRARVYGTKTETFTVGDYCKDGNGAWTARLYAWAGNPKVLNGIVVKPALFTLKNAVGDRGRWWT